MNKQYAKRLKTGQRWIIGSGAVAILGIGGFLAYARWLDPAAETTALTLVTVERSTVQETLSASGIVQLGGQQTLKSPLETGVVEQVLARVNEAVAVGETLVILRDPKRETAVAQQQIEIQKQELELLRVQEQVKAAQARLTAAQQALKTATWDEEASLRQEQLQLIRDREKISEIEYRLSQQQLELDELKVLLEKGFIPANDVRSQERAMQETRSQLRDAEVTAAQKQLEIQRLEDQIAIAQTQPQQDAIAVQTELRNAELNVRTAERNLNSARLQLRDARQELQQSVIAATIDGTVMDINVQAGDVVKAGDSLLTIGNRARERVIIQLSTLDAARVQPNQQALVSIIGPDAEEYPARVESIAQIAKTESSDSSGQGNQATVQAVVVLERPSGKLIPDSSVNVEIILAQQQNAIALNAELIQRDREEAWVWVRNDAGIAEKRNVTLGLEGITTVEIKSGLSEGDRVIQPTPDLDLKPGMPVVESS